MLYDFIWYIPQKTYISLLDKYKKICDNLTIIKAYLFMAEFHQVDPIHPKTQINK